MTDAAPSTRGSSHCEQGEAEDQAMPEPGATPSCPCFRPPAKPFPILCAALVVERPILSNARAGSPSDYDRRLDVSTS